MRNSHPSSQSKEALNLTFAALAHPTRRGILSILAGGEASVSDLVEPFGLTQPTISKHLKVLERAGLVSRGRDAQFRPVRLNAVPLEAAAAWIGNYRESWEHSLDQLEAYAKSLQAQENKHGKRQTKRK